MQETTGGVVAMHCPRQGTPRVQREVGVQVPIGLHGLLYPMMHGVGQGAGEAVMLMLVAMANGRMAARPTSVVLYMVAVRESQ